MSDQVHYHRGVNRSETMVFEEPCGPHDSIPETLIPKGNKSRVLGVGVESIHPATNSPGISVDTNRLDCLAKKSGLDVNPWRLVSPIKQGAIRHVRV